MTGRDVHIGSLARALTAFVLAASAAIAVPPPAAASSPALPSEGALLGAHVAPRDGQDRRSAWTAFEDSVGRAMAIDRQYYAWDDLWPTADDEWSRDAGRTLFISWNSRRTDGTYTSWGSIAAGDHDATIDARAADLFAFGGPVVFAFHHEPEGDPAGAPEQFAAAFRHVRERFEAAGGPHRTGGGVLGASTFGTPAADALYPGDDVVDVVAADGYNWSGCPGKPDSPWRSFGDVFSAFRAFGAAHGKPMAVAEWGTHEDPAQPYRKARWMQEAATQLALWPDVKAAVYYHNDRGCPRWVDSSPASLDAFRDIGADPWLSPPAGIRIVSGPTVSTRAMEAHFAIQADGAADGLRCKLDEGPAEACDAGTIDYSGLTVRPHRFEAWGVDANGERTTPVARWSWTVDVIGDVVVSDHAFDPQIRYTSFGSEVPFSFWGPSTHTVTDATRLDLFDSGEKGVGDAYSFVVPSAGTFAYGCSLHPMEGQIKAGVTASPAAGATTTTFTITWAAGAPAAGFAYDAQIKRPGSTKWRMFRNDTAAPSASFTPSSGPGTYSFRAKLVSLSGGGSGWSGARTITVGLAA